MKSIIIDTDIGFDLDDSWALAFALSCGEFDVKLVSVSDGDLDYKLRLTAKLLTLFRRTDIPIAVGKSNGENMHPLRGYVEDFDLSRYRGKIYRNYPEAYREVLKDGPVDVVGIASMTSLREVSGLLKEKGCRLYAMMGSIYKEHRGRAGTIAEYNACNHIEGTQTVLRDVETFLFPLDCCGMNIMRGESYLRVKRGENAVCKTLMRHYELWLNNYYPDTTREFDIEAFSGILFDLSPLWYLLRPEAFRTEVLPIVVDGEGYTRISEGGKLVTVALETLDLDGLMKTTANALTGVRIDF